MYMCPRFDVLFMLLLLLCHSRSLPLPLPLDVVYPICSMLAHTVSLIFFFSGLCANFVDNARPILLSLHIYFLTVIVFGTIDFFSIVVAHTYQPAAVAFSIHNTPNCMYLFCSSGVMLFLCTFIVFACCEIRLLYTPCTGFIHTHMLQLYKRAGYCGTCTKTAGQYGCERCTVCCRFANAIRIMAKCKKDPIAGIAYNVTDDKYDGEYWAKQYSMSYNHSLVSRLSVLLCHFSPFLAIFSGAHTFSKCINCVAGRNAKKGTLPYVIVCVQ